MHAGDRLLACRVLGLEFPQAESMRAMLDEQGRMLDRYDRHHRPYDPQRWLPSGHDSGDEDRR